MFTLYAREASMRRLSCFFLSIEKKTKQTYIYIYIVYKKQERALFQESSFHISLKLIQMQMRLSHQKQSSQMAFKVNKTTFSVRSTNDNGRTGKLPLLNSEITHTEFDGRQASLCVCLRSNSIQYNAMPY